jgi:hypothetical protein
MFRRKSIKIVDHPKHTTNLFGTVDEIAGKTLQVLDVSADGKGDCLCVFNSKTGKGLIDVDHRDIWQEMG